MGEMFEKLTAEQKARMGYMEGREDLMESKLLHIDREKSSDQKMIHTILAVTRDPGSGNALIPVLEKMMTNGNFEIYALTDNQAQEIIQKTLPTQDVSPSESALSIANSMPKPDALLIDSSKEQGLETYSANNFEEAPVILVEDYYATAQRYLRRLKDMSLPLPVKICVMDQATKDLIIHDFPEISNRIIITGQPAFDKFHKEDTEKISESVKDRLGIKPNEKLYSFMAMSDMNEETATKIATQLQKHPKDFFFAFRKHPKDNTPSQVYNKIFENHGIRALDTDGYSTDEISAASDLIVTTWSTEGLHGIYRRKPTIHITDSNLSNIRPELTLPLPPVKLGASIGLNDLNDLSPSIASLEKGSDSVSKLQTNMEKYYPRDGKNSERVFAEIQDTLNKNINT